MKAAGGPAPSAMAPPEGSASALGPGHTRRTAGPYQAFMAALCLLVLVSLGVEGAFTLDEEVRRILYLADTVVCAFFLFDFLLLMYRAENRARYFFTWGWLDLVSSVPAIGLARAGRAARLARLLRLLRGVRSTRVLGTLVFERRAQSALLAAVLLTLLAVVFSSIAVLQVERDAGGNIDSADDAIWWALVTVATVGYGDRFPVSIEGRAIAAALIVVGLGMLSVLTAFIASWFLHPEEQEQDTELAAIRDELAEIKAMLRESRPRKPL